VGWEGVEMFEMFELLLLFIPGGVFFWGGGCCGGIVDIVS
jgi:hypothetical protein